MNSSFLKNLFVQNQVKGVTADSRKVQEGFIYVAILGTQVDGHQFLKEAQEKGAIALIGEKDFPETHVPYFRVKNSRKALGQLATEFFQYPSDALIILGITGTSGKTTVSYLLEAILKEAGYRVGVIGSVNYRYSDYSLESTLTTPGAVELQNLLAEMKNAQCQVVIMEVSSHALQQHRVEGISFDGVIFTNLSPEHLDYHSNMEAYFQAKLLLFTDVIHYSKKRGKNPIAVVYQGDPYGKRICQLLKHESWVFGFEHPDLKVNSEGISGNLAGIPIHSRLVGDFNSLNIAAALTLAKNLSISSLAIEKGIQQLKNIPGRLECIYRKDIQIWIDHAHKPGALKESLAALKKMNPKRLILVFGCGGNRYQGKRPMMAQLAAHYADLTWVTSDSPRTEDPVKIIHEIILGFPEKALFQVEVDRKKAIFQAIQKAQPGDWICITGRGHERYQIIGTERYELNDQVIVQQVLKSRV